VLVFFTEQCVGASIFAFAQKFKVIAHGRGRGGGPAVFFFPVDIYDAFAHFHPGGAPARPGAARPLGMVAAAAARVGEDFVGAVDALHRLGGRRVGVDVGVDHAAQALISALDDFLPRLRMHLQQAVIVFPMFHFRTPLPNCVEHDQYSAKTGACQVLCQPILC
jgi:hypothetical protein